MSTSTNAPISSEAWSNGETWGTTAQDYASLATLVTRVSAKEVVQRAFRISPPDSSSSMLDNGAGSGIVTEEIKAAQPDAKVLATDISNEMLDLLRSKALPGVSTRIADAFDLGNAGLPAEGFTHVFSNFALQFTDRPERGVVEMAKVVRPGGIVAMSTWNKVTVFSTIEKVGRKQDADFTVDDSAWAREWNDKEVIGKAFEAAGLEIVENEDTRIPWMLNDEQFIHYAFEGKNPVAIQALKKFKGDVEILKKDVREFLASPGLEKPDMTTWTTIGRRPTKVLKLTS